MLNIIRVSSGVIGGAKEAEEESDDIESVLDEDEEDDSGGGGDGDVAFKGTGWPVSTTYKDPEQEIEISGAYLVPGVCGLLVSRPGQKHKLARMKAVHVKHVVASLGGVAVLMRRMKMMW